MLDELLDADQVALSGLVRLELLVGTPRGALATLSNLLGALPLFHPTRDTFDLAESWLKKGRRLGDLFGAADLLIGATAAERGATVWSLDGDFRRMAKLGLVKLFRAPQPRA